MFRHIDWAMGKRGAVILMLAMAIMACSRNASEDQNTTVTGVIHNASGEPVAGALVKVRSADLGLGFMVVSQAQGRYSTPNLPPGEYTVQGFGGDQQSDPAGPVEVSSGAQAKIDIVLSTPRKITPPIKRMTQADYAELMPAGDAKRIIFTKCVFCHGLERIVARRAARDREGWQRTMDRMRFYLEENRVPLSDPAKDTIVDYLAENFGPDTHPLRREQASASGPNGHLPRTLLKGAEAKFVAMEFELQRGVWVHHIAVDSQGVAWFSETNVGVIGSFDPKSFTYTRITLPPGKFPHRITNAVRVDPQDHVWFSDNRPNGPLFQYNPKTKAFHQYDILPHHPMLRSHINTPRFLDGNVWATGITSHRILKLNPGTREWNEYPVPIGSQPYGLAIGGENTIWYSAHYGNEVVRLDPDTGKLARYKVPTPKADIRQMQADAEGNLWVGGSDSSKLVKVDYRTGEVTEHALPTEGAGAFSIDVDTTRNLIWFGELYAGKLGRYDPSTNSFVEFPLPSLDMRPEFSDKEVIWIEVDRSHPNRVWWGVGANARIGYIEVLE